MADDAGRINQVLSETAFLYGGNGTFVENLYAKWAENPGSVEPSWQAFFANLHDSADAAKKQAERPAWTQPMTPAARPDWLSAIDGLWPAVEAKIEKKISAAKPTAGADEVRAATLDSLRAIMMIDSVAGSARNISRISMNSVPLTGSPPMPTAVVWPRPT